MSVIARKPREFTPVVMVAEQHRNAYDHAAVAHVHRLHLAVREVMNTERSRKATIGISEIGADCSRCVARKLSGLYPKEVQYGWKAQVGTFGHAGLEEHFLATYPWMFEHYEEETADGRLVWKTRTRDDLEPTAEQPIYYLERRLKVWEYKGHVIDGSCDLFSKVVVTQQDVDMAAAYAQSDPGLKVGDVIGIVTDWKFQGPRTLAKSAKGEISSQYRVQMNTYGLGYRLQGLTPTHVDLHALPRDGEYDDAKPVLARYDEQVAIDALARLQSMIDGAELIGWPSLIESVPRDPRCFDCPRFDRADEQAMLAEIVGA